MVKGNDPAAAVRAARGAGYMVAGDARPATAKPLLEGLFAACRNKSEEVQAGGAQLALIRHSMLTWRM